MITAALLLAAVQHGGHAAPAACTPAHAKMGHCKLPVQAKPKTRPAVKPRPAPSPPAKPTALPPPAPRASAPRCTHEHAEMGHCSPEPAVPTAAAPSGPSGTDLPAGDGPAPPASVVNYADGIFRDGMAASRAQLYREHGGGTISQVIIDLAEIQLRKGREGYRWNGEGWYGGDRDRLVVKSEGEGVFGHAVDTAEVQALYSRAIGPYFNLQAGVRQDFRPTPSRTYLAAGVEGLAPYWFEVEATAFLSNRGDFSVRVEGHYDQRITQRLILQPRAELNVERGDAALELGLRLRYEIAREFAPYVGVNLEDGDAGLVLGIRTWF